MIQLTATTATPRTFYVTPAAVEYVTAYLYTDPATGLPVDPDNPGSELRLTSGSSLLVAEHPDDVRTMIESP